MKHQKILVIITALVLSMVNILLISNDDKVLASAGGGNDGDGNCNMGINLSYIWEITQKLANVTYDAYNETDIPRGRAFGSKGAQFTIDEILEPEMNYTIGLEDVHTEQIQHIPDSEKNYTSIINMTDFELTINNDNYPYENPVPKTEMYVIPNGYPYNDQGLLTGTNTLDNTKIIQNNITDLWPFAGTYNNYHLNITQDNYEQLNNINQLIIGNLTYLEPEDPPPSKESQHGRVYLLDDTSGCQNKIDNLTIANAGIIIDTGSKGLNYANAENSYLSIVSINENEGDTLKELLTNYTVLVDNITGNLTFTYNLAEGWWPTNNHVYIDRIPDHYELANITWSEGLLIKSIAKYISNRDEPTFVDYYACVNAKTLFWRIINIFRSFECKGVVLFDSHNYHFTMCTFNHWTGESLDEYTISEQFIEQTNMGPSLPVFTLNYTIGSWLLNNRVCTTLDGYADQELTVETPSNPGLEAYNVVGNITIDESPDDAVAIISNRMDGMWGQTPGDSGVGGGIVLGIAKYMKEYNIRPKYNLTFLFTTGEEFRFRGAYHYNDSHPEYNIKYWLILDQLGFDQIDQPLFLYYKNSSHGDILNETFLNQTQYWSRTGYVNITENGDGEGSEQGVASSRPECDSFCIVKGTNYSWDQWHRAGASYTDGDSISHIDRNDVNVTAELAWNVTKYFVVDPDCWFSNYEISSVDTDDADELVDSVDVNYTIESALPSDLLMVKAMIIDDENVVNSEWMNFTVNSPGYTGSIQVTLPSNCSPGEYNFTIILYNSTGRINNILGFSGVNYNDSATEPFVLYPYGYNLIIPDISNVSSVPDTVGYGFNVTISADVTSNVSDIDNVWVIIWEPDLTIHNFTMNKGEGDSYIVVFNDTWKDGVYRFRVWAVDVNWNMSFSSQYVFNISAEATINICTIKDSYIGGEIINLTDPPLDGGGSTSGIGFELLDDNKILHIWNRFDSYYFNTSNGIQFTNHKDNYWSTNVLMLGYYNNDVWNLIYRTDELSGFNKNINSDNETFVNATLWKDLTYNGYDFRLAIRYYLGVDDNELTVIPFIKNIDNEDISYNLGFAWELKDIQVDMTTSGDYIEIDETSYYLNQTLDETYTDLDNPCFYIKEDKTSNTFESLYLRWNNNLNYKLNVESREGQYNAPVTLGIKIGTLNVGQEKYTSLFWHDASEIIFYFDDYAVAEAWASNPSYLVDGNVSNFASTSISEDSECCNNNSCIGSYLGNISKVELRCNASYDTSCVNLKFKPIYNGNNPGSYIIYTPEDSHQWSDWFNVPGDLSGIPDWTWGEVKDLDFFVDADFSRDSFILYCSKVELRVTYTPKSASGISNPVPEDGSTGISISPILSINVSDVDGDNMTITWYSNISGSWQVFGVNSSVGNGTYDQVFSNASVNGQWWYWNVSVDDGEVVNSSDIFSFYTGCESKIHNSGDTNISGYLSIIVEYYNSTSEDWETEMGVIDKSFVVINSGENLGLDTIFNPQNVNTSSFTHGNGTYRVFAMLQDPYGNYLFDGTLGFVEGADDLKAWYEFTVTYD